MWFPNWRERPWKNIDLLIIGVCHILSGLLTICSLGFYGKLLAADYVCWRTKMMLRHSCKGIIK